MMTAKLLDVLVTAPVDAQPEPPAQHPIRLFVGGDCGTARGEKVTLLGDRCFSARDRPQLRTDRPQDCQDVRALLDSGAFGDPPTQRLTPEAALARQLAWERKAGARWGDATWQAYALVSYDRLIDETWVAGERHQRRWTVRAAESAVAETVAAAHYLASQRARLAPRRLVLSCQGVDSIQQEECAIELLKVAMPDDWFGLGGWCIMGKWRSWLPTFWATLSRVLPRVQAAGIRHVHLFGVLYLPALGGLLWLADQYGLSVSTDSKAPITNVTWSTAEKRRKAGARADNWRESVDAHQHELAMLRESTHYRAPPWVPALRQLWLMGD